MRQDMYTAVTVRLSDLHRTVICLVKQQHIMTGICVSGCRMGQQMIKLLKRIIRRIKMALTLSAPWDEYYQEMAKAIFVKQDGVYYCTDKANALNAWM